MKILFLAPRVPWPADTGGKIRTLNILKQLARRYDVDLLSFSFEKEDEHHARELGGLNIRVHLVPAPGWTRWDTARTLLFAKAPLSVSKYFSQDFARKVTTLLGQNSYGLVHMDHIHMAHYCPQAGSLPCVVDEHNVEYKILERCAKVESHPLKRAVYHRQALKMKRFEKEMLGRATACCAVSEDDAAVLRELTGGKLPVKVVPNGVDTEYFRSECHNVTRAQEQCVVFTGSMDWLPNEDAVVYFCEDILPLIWKERPEVRFYVVGKGPAARIRRFARQDERVIVTGRVEDVREYMNRSKVFVVPLRIGGGTRLKILEAMAMGKAVVSTTVGAEGIDYTEHENIELADDPETFCQKVVRLLDEDDQRCAMGQSGRELVVSRYDWPVVVQKLGALYKEAGYEESH